jgi:RNA polymerase primary sigma factor
VHIGQRERKISRTERELALRLGRAPTDTEIAREAELTLAEVEETRAVTRTVTSLDRPLDPEGDTGLGDLLPSEERGPVEEVEIGLREEAVHAALDRLPEQEREVIKLRYGINGDEPTPLREAGRRLGLSPERVRRIEHKALERLAGTREVAGLAEAA